MYTDGPKDLILEDVIIRLETLVSNCFNDDPAMKPLVHTLTKWAATPQTGDYFANFT